MRTSINNLKKQFPALLVGLLASTACLANPPAPKPDSLCHYLAIWTVVMNTPIAPTPDPYTGEQSQAPSVAHSKRIAKIFWRGFLTQKEALDFKSKAPKEAQSNFHIDEIVGGFDG